MKSALSRIAKAGWASLPLRLRAALKQQPDVAQIDYPGSDLFLVVSSPHDLDRAACCAKEPGTVRWIEEHVSGVLYDIGANVGGYALIAWAASGRRTKVIAFEPGSTTFAQLCRNIVLNGCQGSVIPLNVALSDRSEVKRFKYSSMLAGAASHLGLGSENASGQNTAHSVFEQPMLAATLDDTIAQFQLPPPQHVKIDVDGHELAVLRGAQRTLAGGSLRSIQIEIGEQDPDAPTIRTLLESHGFSVARVSPHPTGSIADYVFIRPAGKQS